MSLKWVRTDKNFYVFLVLLFFAGMITGFGLSVFISVQNPRQRAHVDVANSHALSVLFIGNSYISVNSLPVIFQNIAESAGYTRPFVNTYAPGGYTIFAHFADARVRTLIEKGPGDGKRWDAVVLQEQSTVPAYSEINPYEMKMSVASASGLITLIADNNPQSRVILFETWARRADLWKTNAVDPTGFGVNASVMQLRIKNWYESVARESSGSGRIVVTIARVGELWQLNGNSPQPINLYAADGSHPSYAGSYVAAVKLFMLIYNTSAGAVIYNGVLSEKEATELRTLSMQL